MSSRIQTRWVRSLALSWLAMLGCVAMAEGQSSTADASTKSATKKPVSHKPHKSTAKSSASTSRTSSSGKRGSKKKPARARGQQKIDSERATSIQQALIREHYLSGEATGSWNQASEDAMRRFQADQGWQSKTVPDSRALIKLGLGPSKDHLLNPESAMTTVPDRSRTGAPTSQSPSPASTTPSPDSPAPSPNPQ